MNRNSIFRFFQLQIVAFFVCDFLSFFRSSKLIMVNALLLQLGIAVLIGLFLKFSFTKKENIYILGGVLVWLIMPIFVSNGNWIFWVGCLINVTLGIIVGLYLSKKTIPILTLLSLTGIASSYYIGKDFFPKQSLKIGTVNYSKGDFPNFLDTIKGNGYSLRDKNGRYYTLDSFKNKVILFDFWFIRCMPCAIKDRSLYIISDKYKMNNIFLIVKVIPGSINSFDEFVQFDNSPKPMLSLFDSGGIITKKLKVNQYPQEYIINKNGNLVSTFDGFGRDLNNEYIKLTMARIDSLTKQ